MKVNFQYGENGLDFDIDDKFNVDILEPDEPEPLADPVESIYKSFNSPQRTKPLKKLLMGRTDGDIVIVVEDHTRPMPTKIALEAYDKIFRELNIEDDRIKILVATGLHRRASPEELKRMMGDEFIERFDIIFHDANKKEELDYVGTTSFGNEVYFNTFYVNAAFKIVTGYVEPHFFAGFSGGRKSLVPGIAGRDTILFNHSPKHIHSGARFGVLKGNLVHEDALEASKFAKPDFATNLILNSAHKVVKVASGSLSAIHSQLVDFQKIHSFKKIQHQYDIVLCGNGGYPLDQNLYQSVKSMAIGELAVKENGVIIAINECSDGVGQEEFNKLINSGKSPEQIYKDALNGAINVPDVWEIQILARVLNKAKIIVVSSMNENEIGNIGLRWAPNVTDALEQAKSILNKKEEELSVLVLPKGPLVIPKLNLD
ncbi:MAG: nickel-dependent lactate racemase [Promethearchaeota archaeon]